MRKFLLCLILLASAVFWTSCGGSNDSTGNSIAPKANDVGTTTYNAPSMTSNSVSTTAAPPGGGASNMANSNKGAPKGTQPPHIKPPT